MTVLGGFSHLLVVEIVPSISMLGKQPEGLLYLGLFGRNPMKSISRIKWDCLFEIDSLNNSIEAGT